MDDQVENKSFGQIVDNLGIAVSLEPDELVSDALVLVKIVDAEGGIRMSTSWSEGMDWITRLGLVTAAYGAERPIPSNIED